MENTLKRIEKKALEAFKKDVKNNPLLQKKYKEKKSKYPINYVNIHILLW